MSFTKNLSHPVTGLAKVLTLAALSSSLICAQTPTNVVTGYYYGGNSGGIALSSLKVSGLTYLNYAFAALQDNTSKGPSPNTKLPPYTCAAPNPLQMSELQQIKTANPKLKILLSIGGAGATLFSSAAKDTSTTDKTRENFVASCTSTTGTTYAKALSGIFDLYPGLFDGIDVDWEYPGASDTANFTSLMQAFRTSLTNYAKNNGSAETMTLSAAIGPEDSPYGWQYVQLGTVAGSVDFLNVMTYDYAGDWDVANGIYYTASNAPLSQIETNLNLIEKQGVPAGKIVMGIPFYGVHFTGVTKSSNTAAPNYSLGQPGVFDSIVSPYPRNTESYAAIAKSLSSGTVLHDSDGSAWVYNASKHDIWQYDDATSIANKAKYITSQKLGGIMAWDLSQDTSNQALLAAMVAAMPKSTTPTSTVLYDFEKSMDGWIADSTSLQLSDSTAEHFSGADSLQVNFIVYRQNWVATTNLYVQTASTLPAGAKVQFKVWIPANPQLASIDAFVQDSNGNWGADDNQTSFATGGWYTFTATVPNGGGAEVGLQFSNITTLPLWSGTIYVDSVTLIQ